MTGTATGWLTTSWLIPVSYTHLDVYKRQAGTGGGSKGIKRAGLPERPYLHAGSGL